MKKRIVFFGTPSFAVEVLKQFHDAKNIEIVGIVSNPDAKIGRKQILTPSPVKQWAMEKGIPVFTPENANDHDFLEQLQSLNADFFIVVSYGKILPKILLDIPHNGTFNLHFSLLPKYRGASPVQSALLNGEKSSGITIFKIVPELDAGDIYMQEEISIAYKTTDQCLQEMTKRGGEMFLELLNNFKKYSPISQHHCDASFCKKIQKQDGEIHADLLTAEEIQHRFFAYTPWPGIYSFTKEGLRLLWKEIGTILPENNHLRNTLFHFEGKVYLQTKNGALEIKSIQIEGKNRSPARVLELQ